MEKVQPVIDFAKSITESLKISEWVKMLDEIAGGNEFLVAFIGGGIMATLSYFLRSVPRDIWDFLKKQLTTELVLTSSEHCFGHMNLYINTKLMNNSYRKIKFNSKSWLEAQADNTTYGNSYKTIGYGNHIIWLDKQPVRINLTREKSDSYTFKEIITFTKFGRSHKLYDRMLTMINAQIEQEKEHGTYVYKWDNKEADWRKGLVLDKRGFDSVVIDASNQEVLTKQLDKFVSKKEWYVKHGIPHKLGIMLYGEPGTGKTSLIKAIASHLDKSISVLPAVSLGNIDAAMSTLEDDSIIVIEDVDSNSATNTRYDEEDTEDLRSQDSTSKKKKKKKNKEVPGKLNLKGDLSGLLNSIDGLVSSEERILIMTTNKLDDLDPALVRPGRIDLCLNITYFTIEEFKRFLLRFFGDKTEVDFENYTLVNTELTGAKLQQDILLELPFDEILLKYGEFK